VLAVGISMGPLALVWGRAGEATLTRPAE
jgi:hypothetical protein